MGQQTYLKWTNDGAHRLERANPGSREKRATKKAIVDSKSKNLPRDAVGVTSTNSPVRMPV